MQSAGAPDRVSVICLMHEVMEKHVYLFESSDDIHCINVICLMHEVMVKHVYLFESSDDIHCLKALTLLYRGGGGEFAPLAVFWLQFENGWRKLCDFYC